MGLLLARLLLPSHSSGIQTGLSVLRCFLSHLCSQLKSSGSWVAAGLSGAGCIICLAARAVHIVSLPPPELKAEKTSSLLRPLTA